MSLFVAVSYKTFTPLMLVEYNARRKWCISIYPLHIYPLTQDLKYRNHIRRRPNRPNNMQRRTRQEKRPPLLLCANIAQPLQIPHLAYRRPPVAQQPLVKAAVLGIRPGFPAHGVAGHGREVLGVEPADGVHVALDADEGEDP